MSAPQEVLLVCMHMGRASHDSGGRTIKCETCNVESVVHAKTRKIVQYEVYEVNYQMRLEADNG